jgi:hypothetical protein
MMETRLHAQPKFAPAASFTPVRGGLLQRKCGCGGPSAAEGECEGCGKRKLSLQRSSQKRERETLKSGAVPAIVHDVIHSSGEPLDATTRTFMESRFGHDFSRVRVHTNARAAASALAVNALAYTVGNNLVFQKNQYRPTSPGGQKVLAHELTHVMQQEQGSAPLAGITPADHASEREADHIAEQVVSAGGSISPPTAAAVPGLQRFAGPDVPVTPAQIQEMRVLFQEISALMRAGTLAEEGVAISAAVAEAEAAIVVAGEVAAAGATATAVGETALGATAVLAADDVTGVGIADDVAIPFVLLAAAVAFGVGFAIGSSAAEIAAAWRAAAEAVRRAVDLMRRAAARPRPLPPPEVEPRPQPEPRPGPRPVPPEEEERQNCFQRYPYALHCEEEISMEEQVIEFIMRQGYNYDSLGDCRGYSTHGPGVIRECNGSSGETWHCDVSPYSDPISGQTKPGGVVSIFSCLCCRNDGSTGHEWRGAHWSPGAR